MSAPLPGALRDQGEPGLVAVWTAVSGETSAVRRQRENANPASSSPA